MQRRRQGPLILANSLARPWTSHGFQASWRRGHEGRHRRPHLSRSARHGRHSPRDRRMHRGRDRHDHRPQPARRAHHPRRASTCTVIPRSPRARSGSSKPGQNCNGKREIFQTDSKPNEDSTQKCEKKACGIKELVQPSHRSALIGARVRKWHKAAKPRRRVYVSFWQSSGSAWTDGLGCLRRE